MSPFHRSIRWVLPGSCGMAAASLQGQITLPPEPPIHHVGLAYRMGFNLQADFINRGQYYPLPPGEASNHAPRTYTDGYVREDSSGNAGGLTWNWGYHSPEQIQGDTLTFLASNPGTLDGSVRDEVVPGIELSYALQLGQPGRTEWGVEAALNFARADFSSRTQPSTSLLARDTYSLGGILPPTAPYLGTFEGPGPLLTDTAQSTALAVEAELETGLYGLRLGPFIGLPLGSRLGLRLSGGFAAVLADSEFSFVQAPVDPVGSTPQASGARRETECLPGGYLAANLLWSLSTRTAITLGLQYQNTGQTTIDAGDKRAELDLRRTFFLAVGLNLQWF